MTEPNEPISVTGQGSLPPVARRFLKWLIVSWALIGVLILAGVIVWSLSLVREIFPPLVIALIAVYLLNPVVTRLEGFGVRRVFGSCMSYLLGVALLAIALGFLIPALIDQGRAFVRDLPDTIEQVSTFLERVTRGAEDRFGPNIDISERLARFASGAVGSVGGFLQGAVQTMTFVVIGLIAGFYLLVDLPRLRAAALRLVPPDRRDEARQVASSVGTAMGGFFRGQLLVALIVGVMSSIGLRIIGLPYWLVVGFIAGAFNLVPLIGPFVGAVPAIIIAAATKPPITIVWVMVVMLVVQQIDNHFISPNVMRLTVRLHPVTVMISLIAGATLAGFYGMLLTVPLVASIKVIAAHFWRTHVPWGHEVFEEAEKMEMIPKEQAPPTPVSTPAEPDPPPLSPTEAQRPPE
ncbi:MAG: AI-2E family transporter [Actinomycetota bacterium]